LAIVALVCSDRRIVVWIFVINQLHMVILTIYPKRDAQSRATAIE
jgi:hypothetical protein